MEQPPSYSRSDTSQWGLLPHRPLGALLYPLAVDDGRCSRLVTEGRGSVDVPGMLDTVQLIEGQLLLSATDLVGHLACEHLTSLELGAAQGEWPRPVHEDPELDLLQKKGVEHERRCLER